MAEKLTKKIPTNIITGFLGVGKTTAILSLLKQKPENENWAVLVNEFGEVGVDGAFLSEQGALVKEVPGGCMCCVAGLPMAIGINALLAQNPDRLLIEPTGLGHPKDIIGKLLSEHYENYIALNATITLVDPRNFSDLRYTENQNFQDQLALADVVVANKTDLCSPDDIAAFDNYVSESAIAKLASGSVEQGELKPEWLALPRIDRDAQFGHHHSHDDDEMSSRRHLLPSVVPLRTQRATFTALGSSLHEGTDWHPATYKAARAGSCQELRHCFFDFLLAKYSWY